MGHCGKAKNEIRHGITHLKGLGRMQMIVKASLKSLYFQLVVPAFV